MIRKAWTEEKFSYRGEFYRIDEISVRPRPMQKPHPPIWMAALSPDTFDLCARYGFHLLCAPVFGFDLDAGAAHIERYRARLTGRPSNGRSPQVAALTITYVADTTQQAQADLRDSVLWYYRTLARYIATPKNTPAAAGYEFYGAARDFLTKVDWDTVVKRGAVVCGSPAEVVERIAEIRERCGMSHYLAWTRIGGLAKDKVLRSMELMATDVMAQLR